MLIYSTCLISPSLYREGRSCDLVEYFLEGLISWNNLSEYYKIFEQMCWMWENNIHFTIVFKKYNEIVIDGKYDKQFIEFINDSDDYSFNTGIINDVIIGIFFRINSKDLMFFKLRWA